MRSASGTRQPRPSLCVLSAEGARRCTGAPVMPPEFWDAPHMRSALATRHMGKVVRAYRHHPDHGRPLSQEVVAGWMYLTQSQLSRVENGPPMRDLDRLIQWARILSIPTSLLWFRVPDDRGDEPVTPVPPTGSVPSALAPITDEWPRISERQHRAPYRERAGRGGVPGSWAGGAQARRCRAGRRPPLRRWRAR